MKIKFEVVGSLALLSLWWCAIANAQDLQKHVVYICNGEKIMIDSCNIRDTSDSSTCMVGHPDTILPNGLMKYTYETRGTLKKLLPTCKQPSAEEMAREKAFEKKVQDQQDANVKKADEQAAAYNAQMQAAMTGTTARKPMTSEQRALNRCITSGRLPATCTGNTLMKSFEGMIGQMLPSIAGPIPPGPYIGGNFIGKGEWRIEFDDRFAMMSCGGLAPSQYNYTLALKNSRAVITIDNSPKPLVLDVGPDGLLANSGPVVVNGHVVVGSRAVTTTDNSGVYRDSSGQIILQSQADFTTGATRNGLPYTRGSNTTTSYTPEFAPKTVTCSQALLTSKGAPPSATDIGTNFLKSMFNDGETGPKAPAGLRMQGSYGGQGGMLLEFYPESAVISCGDAAHAYPYQVQAGGAVPEIKLEDPAHALVFTLKPDGELDGPPGPYQVQGRSITGQNENGDFTFVPLNATCNLGSLKPGATPGAAPPPTMMTAATTGAPANGGGSSVSTPNAPSGNAVLTIASGLPPAQPNGPNPLGGYPYVLLRENFGNALAQGGIQVPTGTPPAKFYAISCQNRSPDCPKIAQIWKSDAVSAARGDATGKATLPGVAPGTYFLMITIRYNNQPCIWDLKVDLKPGANSVTLDQQNATLLK
jgi:hypothetical protein